MRICMYSIDAVFNNRTGGSRRFVELLKALKNKGHNVELISADSLDIIISNGIKGFELNKGNKDKWLPGLRVVFNNRDIFRWIKYGKFDRVIVFDIRAGFSLVLNGINNIYLFLRQDLILYKEIMFDDQRSGRIKRKLFLTCGTLSEALCLKWAKKIIVTCEFDLNQLLNRHKLLRNEISRKSIVQINNINPSWIIDSGRKYNSYIDHYRKYDLVFVGNFKDSRKGHNVLLPAIESLIEDGSVINTAIIGDGKQMDEYKRKFGNIKGINFLGRLADPISVIVSSRLMIVPSYVDSCPNTIMEALYYNVPVIGANRSGIPEILNNSEWLFELDVEEIKIAIKKSLDSAFNESLRKKQMIRRKELFFDWGEKMVEIISKDGV